MHESLRGENEPSEHLVISEAASGMRCCPPAPTKPDAILSKGPIDLLLCSICHSLPLYSVLVYLLHGLLHATKVQAPRKAETCPSCAWKHGNCFTHSASPSTHVGVQVKSLCCCQSSSSENDVVKATVGSGRDTGEGASGR